MAQIELNTKYLGAAYSCVSTKETRYYLMGVFVTPAPDATGRGVLLVATDEHRMALIHDANGVTDRPRILQIDPKAKALKPGVRGRDRVLHIDALEKGGEAVGRVAYELRDGEELYFIDALHVCEIDGTFPDWTRVLPGAPSGDIAVYSGNFFNSDYLASFGAALRRITGNRTELFSLAQPDRGGPAWVWSSRVPEARFVIMPARVDAEPGRPFWISLATGAPAQAAAE